MRVWLIDDQADVRCLLAGLLETATHGVDAFAGAAPALQGHSGASLRRPDVIMVSGQLAQVEACAIGDEPGRRTIDSVGFIREIRIRADATPILLYASVDCPARKRVQALDAGADDFITAPLERPVELLARLRALRRRASGLVYIEVLQCGLISVDLAQRRVEVEGVAAPLGVLEYRLLVYLARRVGAAVSIEELLEALFESRGHRAHGPDRSRAPGMLVSRLRRKLGRARAQLVTVPGVGFKLESSRSR